MERFFLPKNKINLEQITFNYGKSQIFHNLSAAFALSHCTILTGPSGSGKSTLLKLIAGLYPKYQGQLVTGKVEVSLKKAMMFQDPSEQFTMPTPREEIIFSLENLQVSLAQYTSRLKKAVDFAELQTILDRKFTSLSGGEKQRAALGVLVAMDVDLFILDEPFASIDPLARKFLIKKLLALKSQGKTIILSDHDLSGYDQLCDHLFKVTSGQLQTLPLSKIGQADQEQGHFHFPLPRPETPPLFSGRNLEIKRQDKILIQQQQLKLYAHKTTLITGANGSGKSSLFQVLSHLLPYSGHLSFQGKELAQLKPRKYLRKVGQIFQNANDQFLAVTVQDELNLALKHSRWNQQELQAALEQLRLKAHLQQIVYTLSGGQKKKLQILLMLLAGQETLLIDEPLSGLDADSIAVVLQMLQQKNKSLFIISHRLAQLAPLCDFHLELKERKLTYVQN